MARLVESGIEKDPDTMKIIGRLLDCLGDYRSLRGVDLLYTSTEKIVRYRTDPIFMLFTARKTPHCSPSPP